MDLCLNLCELLTEDLLNRYEPDRLVKAAMATAGADKPDRIYLGSSFCSQYFKSVEDAWTRFSDYIESEKIPVTLTVPVVSQKDLSHAKESIERLLKLSRNIDEITVNDFGMLGYVYTDIEMPVNLGRLFFKDPRDPRSKYFYEKPVKPMEMDFLKIYPEINGIELDPFAREIDLSDADTRHYNLAVHSPYCYLTTGNICKFASIGAQPERKFRPNMECARQCSVLHEYFTTRFQDNAEPTEVFRVGRTAYFNNDGFKVIGTEPDRLVHFPLKMLTEWARKR